MSRSVHGRLLAGLAHTGEGRGSMRGRSLSSCFLRDGDNSNGYFFSDNGRRKNLRRVRNKQGAEEDYRHLVGQRKKVGLSSRLDVPFPGVLLVRGLSTRSEELN